MSLFRVFAFLWALSALFDLVALQDWFESPAHLLLAVSAVSVLARPSSVLAFAIFNGVRLVAFVHDSPQTPNHQVLYSMASATMLVALARCAWKQRRATGISAEDWLASSISALRAELVVLYFFAVLHKLNSGYLDPSQSCALDVFQRAAPGFLARIDWPSNLLIFGSLATEAAIPLLLSFRRTRGLGVALGVLFHSLLGLHWYHFSTGVFAFYVLFIPRGVIDAALSAFGRLRERRNFGLLSPQLLFGAVLLLVGAMAWARSTSIAHYTALIYVWALGVLAALAIALFPRDCRRHWTDASENSLRRAGAILAFPVVLFLFGASPYLGLRTVPAFSMFSNLRTEGGVSNHLLIPAGAFRIAAYQNDPVLVLDADDRMLRGWARRRERHTFYDLQQRVQELARTQASDVRLSFRRGGRAYQLTAAQHDAQLMQKSPWVVRKWLNFRPVPRSNRPVCTW